MKKLLLVLLVVALAAFLFVGCIPVTPTEGEGEGEGEVEICPTVAISGSVDVGGKTYIKAGSATITVTFAVPTEPVSVYVGDCFTKDMPDGVPYDAKEVVMYTTDNLTYTGTFDFAGHCCEAYIYVLTCEACAPCKYPFTVDEDGPEALIEIGVVDCTCAGCELTFKSTTEPGVCEPATECCDDLCSGLASWSVVLYEKDPFDECCDVPCEEPIGSCSGIGCPIDCTTPCLTGGTLEAPIKYYAVITLVDEVGNETVYYAKIALSGDGLTKDCAVVVYEGKYVGDGETCVDWQQEETTDTVGICLPVI